MFKELKVIKYAVLTFTCMFPSAKSLQRQMGNMATVFYIIEMESGRGTQDKTLTYLDKDIWDYSKSENITITVEYLPEVINKEVDFQ